MAKIPEAFGMAQYSWATVAEANTGNFIQLNSNITHQVRIAFNVGTVTLLAVADSAANATNTTSQVYIRAGASGPDFELCGTPSKLWVRSNGGTTSTIYAFAWTLENADLA
jgi:hypothetical protein